jgi:Protein of unknown function (DUF2637)
MTEVTQLRPADEDLAGIAMPEGMAPQQAGEPRWWHKFTGRNVTSAAFGVLLVGVQGVVQAESWKGLTGFAGLIHITGTATQGVPITLDGVSTIAALLALRAELADEASGRERGAMYLFTLASCAANYWHGSISGGIEGALYFAGMSLAVMFVFDMLLRQIRRAVRRRAGRRARPMPQFGLMQWLRYPRTTFRAWSLSLAHGYDSPQQALDAARDEAIDLPELAIDDAVLQSLDASHRLAVAFGATGTADVKTALALLRSKGAPVDSSHAYKVRNQILSGAQS